MRLLLNDNMAVTNKFVLDMVNSSILKEAVTFLSQSPDCTNGSEESIRVHVLQLHDEDDSIVKRERAG